MVYKESFQFKLNNGNPGIGNIDEEAIYLASRHKGIYDIYVVNGLEYQREIVASFIEQGKWIVI